MIFSPDAATRWFSVGAGGGGGGEGGDRNGANAGHVSGSVESGPAVSGFRHPGATKNIAGPPGPGQMRVGAPAEGLDVRY